MDFDEGSKARSKSVKTEKGTMGLKFMQRAQLKEKESLKA
jgi:hypothetical protein